MQEVTALYPDRAVFDHADKERFHMFDLVSGSKEIRERFSQRNRWEDVRDYWYKDVDDFRQLSHKQRNNENGKKLQCVLARYRTIYPARQIIY